MLDGWDRDMRHWDREDYRLPSERGRVLEVAACAVGKATSHLFLEAARLCLCQANCCLQLLSLYQERWDCEAGAAYCAVTTPQQETDTSVWKHPTCRVGPCAAGWFMLG